MRGTLSLICRASAYLLLVVPLWLPAATFGDIFLANTDDASKRWSFVPNLSNTKALLGTQNPRDYGSQYEVPKMTRTHFLNVIKKQGWRQQGEMLSSKFTSRTIR